MTNIHVRHARRRGFSMLEILVALVFVSFAFLPIYNMFRFGTRGTASNAREVEMTNYASDLINFIRERKATELEKVFKKGFGEIETLHKDADIIARLNPMSKNSGSEPVIPPITESHYNRSMSVTKYMAKNKKGLLGIAGAISDFLNQRSQVLNYLVSVKVVYTKTGSMNPEDEVVLYTLVMD